MINGLEGIPGSGKSYEAVVFHVLSALKTGRRVITNLPLNVDNFAAVDPAFRDLLVLRTRSQPMLGDWNANAVDEKGNGTAFTLSSEGVTHEATGDSPVFGAVWDFYDTWRHSDGRGALFVVDECHVPFPVQGTDKRVVEWFKLHRHFNQDVLLMTQSFRDINQPMARLVGMLIKVRKADILGRKDSYIRKVHAGYRGAVISTDERKYQPQFFPLYKSHTQGLSVGETAATDVKPFLVKFNRFKWVWLAVTAVYGAYAFWPKPAKPKPVEPVIARQSSPVAAAPKPLLSASAASASFDQVLDLEPEPLQGKTIHITGWLEAKNRVIHTFAVAVGGTRQFDLSQIELHEAGYTWKPLAHCMGYLTFKHVTRSVTCDPPTVGQGTNSAPVVIDVGSGRSSADRGRAAAAASPTVPVQSPELAPIPADAAKRLRS